MDERTTFTQEFEGAADLAPEQVNTDAPETVKEAAEKKTYTMLDGSQGSRNAFIKEQFVNLNKSRKEIAAEFGFPYRVVYSATVNMTNDAEASSKGRSAGNVTIKVNAENQLVEVKENEDGSKTTYVNGEIADVEYAEEDLRSVSRNEWIKEQVDAGVSRGDIAKILDVSYGVVYGLTKDAEGTRATHMITLEDGTEIPRSEYIRQLAAEGMSRGDIAKKLGVEYSVVWQATKTQKTDAEKFAEAVEAVAAFDGKVSDPEMFADAIATLRAIQVVEPEEEAEEAAEATEA